MVVGVLVFDSLDEEVGKAVLEKLSDLPCFV